jgi:hypothetical protein
VRNLVGCRVFVVAGQASDDVSMIGDLVEVCEIAFGAEQHDRPRLARFECTQRAVDCAEHEQGCLGELVLVEREVAMRRVGLGRRLHRDRKSEVLPLRCIAAIDLDAPASLLRQDECTRASAARSRRANPRLRTAYPP